MEKKSPGTVAEALDRLTRALDRLDTAARDVPALRGLKNEQAALTAKLAEATKANAILREASNRVATKLDGQIARLSLALKD